MGVMWLPLHNISKLYSRDESLMFIKYLEGKFAINNIFNFIMYAKRWLSTSFQISRISEL